MNTARQKCNMYLDKKRYRLVYIYCHNCFSSKTSCPLVKKKHIVCGHYTVRQGHDKPERSLIDPADNEMEIEIDWVSPKP